MKNRLVFVYGSWCSYCKDMSIVLDQIPDIDIERINIEAEYEKLATYMYDQKIAIDSVPFFIFETDGKVVNTHAGTMTAAEILSSF